MVTTRAFGNRRAAPQVPVVNSSLSTHAAWVALAAAHRLNICRVEVAVVLAGALANTGAVVEHLVRVRAVLG